MFQAVKQNKKPTTAVYLQATLGQFQGVLADHQHQEDQRDPEDPLKENCECNELPNRLDL